MRILVYPHSMEIGGSQLNAVELALGLARRGHTVTVIGEPGPLVERVASGGLDHVEIPLERSRPSPAVTRTLLCEARRRDIEVVHAFEWPPAIEAWAAFAALRRPLVVASIMSMSVAPFLPPDLPLTVGTRTLVRHAQKAGYRQVRLLEPPVDTDANAPEYPVEQLRALVPALPGVLDVVVVSRLAVELKLPGLLEAVEAVAQLPDRFRARLVIVGDGPARGTVAAKVNEVNARMGREVAVLAGEMGDPRAAYSAAAVCLGMGGSALRAMAMGRPLIVQGERGFWETLTRDTAERFLTTGWYGIGDGSTGVPRLTEQLASLLASGSLRAELGRFGRELVSEHYSLSSSAASLETWYTHLLGPRSLPVRSSQLARTMPSVAQLLVYKVQRRYRRSRGVAASDDFNAIREPANFMPAAGATSLPGAPAATPPRCM